MLPFEVQFRPTLNWATKNFVQLPIGLWAAQLPINNKLIILLKINAKAIIIILYLIQKKINNFSSTYNLSSSI